MHTIVIGLGIMKKQKQRKYNKNTGADWVGCLNLARPSDVNVQTLGGDLHSLSCSDINLLELKLCVALRGDRKSCSSPADQWASVVKSGSACNDGDLNSQRSALLLYDLA